MGSEGINASRSVRVTEAQRCDDAPIRSLTKEQGVLISKPEGICVDFQEHFGGGGGWQNRRDVADLRDNTMRCSGRAVKDLSILRRC